MLMRNINEFEDEDKTFETINQKGMSWFAVKLLSMIEG